MKTEDILIVLSKYKFSIAGEICIKVNDNFPMCNLYDDWIGKGRYSKFTGIVYLWILFSGSDIIDVSYVGKAGKTLKQRADQHRGGFTGSSKSKKGQKNGENIKSFLKEQKENSIKIFARISPMISINDEILSSVSIDEESFIKKFANLKCNLWNNPV